MPPEALWGSPRVLLEGSCMWLSLKKSTYCVAMHALLYAIKLFKNKAKINKAETQQNIDDVFALHRATQEKNQGSLRKPLSHVCCSKQACFVAC